MYSVIASQQETQSAKTVRTESMWATKLRDLTQLHQEQVEDLRLQISNLKSEASF